MVVVFISHAWAPNPEAIARVFAKYPQQRHAVVYWLLFAPRPDGNRDPTGQKLVDAFGAELCNAVAWETCSRRVTASASDSPPTDHAHVCAVLTRHGPSAVLALGKPAIQGVMDTRTLFAGELPEFHLLTGPHPTATRPTAGDELRACGAKVMEELTNQSAKSAT